MVLETQHITHEILEQLFHNEGPLIVRFPKFVAANARERAMKDIYQSGFGFYDDVLPKVGKIGITQNEHKRSAEAKREYFAQAEQAHHARRDVLAHSGDLLYEVMGLLKNAWSGHVAIAEENVGEQYFAGLIRIVNSILLHFDWAGRDAEGWDIGKIDAQLSWNIYLQMGIGGNVRVYQRAWEPDDEQRYKIPQSYAYDTQVVTGVAYDEISPQAGDLILFNSRNYHEVMMSEGPIERISLTSFIGLKEAKQQLVLWS